MEQYPHYPILSLRFMPHTRGIVSLRRPMLHQSGRVRMQIQTKKNRLHSQRMETIFILYKIVLTCLNAHALPLLHVGRRPLQG